jgi:hypothetical protein
MTLDQLGATEKDGVCRQLSLLGPPSSNRSLNSFVERIES